MMNSSYKSETIEKSVYKIQNIFGHSNTFPYQNTLHYDKSFTFTWFVQGHGKIIIEGITYEISDGDAIILNNSELHHVEIASEFFCHRMTLYISEEILKIYPFEANELFDAFLKRDRGVGNKIPYQTLSQNGITDDIKKIFELSEAGGNVNEALAICKITELLDKLTKLSPPNPPIEINSSSSNTITAAILGFVNENYSKELNCEKIAKLFHINKFHMERLFKKSVGMSLWDYIISRRLLFCNELIRGGSSIKEASFASGFNNYSNFYRLYKKHMGITPLEFKNQERAYALSCQTSPIKYSTPSATTTTSAEITKP